MTIHQQIIDELATLRMRATTPRVAILEIFRTEQERMEARAAKTGERTGVVHLNVDEMFKRLLDRKIDVGLATVYRVMQQFEAAGILSSSRFDADRVTYELNQGRPHDHIVCMNCGRVDEFYDQVMVARQKVVADGLGYMLNNHQLALYGICPVCQEKMNAGKKGSRMPTGKGKR